MLRHLNPSCGPITLVNNTILVGFQGRLNYRHHWPIQSGPRQPRGCFCVQICPSSSRVDHSEDCA
jgi:hypothetical protein